MITTPSSVSAPLEPDPSRWLTDSRLSDLRDDLESSLELLQMSGLLRAVVCYWIRHQVSLESSWISDDSDDKLSILVDRWKTDPSNSKSPINDNILRQKLAVTPACEYWSMSHWKNLLPSLYLQKKPYLDLASCSIVVNPDKNLLLEVYHQIKSAEISFAQAVARYCSRNQFPPSGEIPLRPVGKLPYGLSPLIDRLSVGQITMPLSIGSDYCLVQLDDFRPSTLDEKNQMIILAEQLMLWIDSTADLALRSLLDS